MAVPKAKMSGTRLNALGGDIFAGLFTFGVQKAGFNILGHLEHTNYGTATARLNFPDLDIRNGMENWRAEEFAGKVDFMYMNPPCAAWSSNRGGGKTTWRDHTDRLRFIVDLVDTGLLIKPKVWALESVTNAWRHGRDFLLACASRWAEAGWHVTILRQNNARIGGTQNRFRVFLIAHKHPLIWQPFTQAKPVRELFAPLVGVKDLPHPHPYAKAPETMVEMWKEAKHHRGRLRIAMSRLYPGGDAPSPKPAFAATRLDLDRPPSVFLGGTRLTWHPSKPRHITWPEALALNGLPMTWVSACRNQTAAELELSRAVLPGVGEWLGRSVAAGLAAPPLRGKPAIRVVNLEKPEESTTELLWTLGDAPIEPFDIPPPPPIPAKSPRIVVEGQTARAPRAAGRPGSGARIRAMLEQGYDTEAILEKIREEFPESRATSSDVSWNRRKLRQLKGEM